VGAALEFFEEELQSLQESVQSSWHHDDKGKAVRWPARMCSNQKKRSGRADAAFETVAHHTSAAADRAFFGYPARCTVECGTHVLRLHMKAVDIVQRPS